MIDIYADMLDDCEKVFNTLYVVSHHHALTIGTDLADMMKIICVFECIFLLVLSDIPFFLVG